MTSPLAALADIITSAELYRRNCEVVARAQYLSSDELRRKHLLLGIPALIGATVVGTTIFATLQNNPDTFWKIAAGMIAMVAAFLSALQTLLNFSERAEKHKSAGASYSSMRREFEIFILRFQHVGEDQRTDALTALEKLHRDLTKLGEDTPSVPDRHWDKANRETPAQTESTRSADSPTPAKMS